MSVFAGIDLAWSGRRPTGVCVFEGDGAAARSLRLDCTASDCDALSVARLLSELGEEVVAGIDAPLIVAPGRDAEARMARQLGRFGVYAYSARADFLERHGIVQGPRLGVLLAETGWNLDPSALFEARSGRHALEVFPHATIVSLLGAPAALKYKKGRLAGRVAELAVFQRLLREYLERELPGLAALPLLTAAPEALRGTALKAVEDQLDALACAIAAHHAWKYGEVGTMVFGDSGLGYIAVPRPVDRDAEAELPV